MTVATKARGKAAMRKPTAGKAPPASRAKIQAKAQAVMAGLAGEVDELAELLAWELSVKDDPRTKRLKDLKEKLGIVADADTPADQVATLTGARYAVEWTARGNEREVNDLRALHKRLGDEVFYASAKMPVKALNQHLSESELVAYTTTALTGPRKCRGPRPLMRMPG